MWRMINLFFFRKTINNWGMPWHLILSWLGVALLKIWLPLPWVAAGVLFTGLVYEVIQLARIRWPEERKEAKWDSFEDIIADVIGVLFGIFL